MPDGRELLRPVCAWNLGELSQVGCTFVHCMKLQNDYQGHSPLVVAGVSVVRVRSVVALGAELLGDLTQLAVAVLGHRARYW